MRPWKASLRSAVVASALTLTACDVVDPWLAPGAEQFAPPAVYERWWSMVEACSGLSRPMGDVPFYVVRGASSVPLENGGVVAAYWSPAGDWIVLAEYYQMYGPVVRHEMLHALLQRTGHPRQVFLDRCAGVNLCGPSCVSDAGPPPTPLARVGLSPNQLVLGLEVIPQLPRLGDQDGFFSIVVTARNPTNEAIYIAAGAGGLPPAFSFHLSGEGGGFGGGGANNIEQYLFAPGETKRQVYDFRIGLRDVTGWAFPAGEYMMRGGYGNVWSPFRTLTLSP
jgi:hypothetical protein